MNENKYIVYKHTSPNGKVYIGITNQRPKHRWNNGNGYKQCTLFYRAIEKYGWENFTHEILFEKLTKEEAETKEIELISYYNSNQKEYGYNLLSGGGTLAKHSQESIEKMRKAKIGKIVSEETKQKMSIYRIGRKVSEETKKKISIAQKGENSRWYGTHHTDEWKKKVSEKLKGSNNPMFEKKQSDEIKQRISEHTKNKRAIVQLTMNNEVLKIYPSAKQVERETGIWNSNIIACCKGKKRQAGGYFWKYKEEVKLIF